MQQQLSNQPMQFEPASNSNNEPAKQENRYIYTEADLGEGVLELSTENFYHATQQFSGNLYNYSSYAG